MQQTQIARLSSYCFCLLCCSVAAVCQPLAQHLDSDSPTFSRQNAPLPAEQVVRKLEERNAQRARALLQFDGTRVYRMQYRGFPGDREAEMVVHVRFQAPNSRKFTIISESGSKFIVDHVLKKLLESEQDAATQDNGRYAALSTENYTFTLAGYEAKPEGAQYILNLEPRTKNKYLYRGRIWVDATDFAVARIEAEPAKNPSLWIKRTEVQHKYVKVNEFWLPAENHTESVIRLGGRAILSIEYKDYRITKAMPLSGSDSSRQDRK